MFISLYYTTSPKEIRYTAPPMRFIIWILIPFLFASCVATQNGERRSLERNILTIASEKGYSFAPVGRSEQSFTLTLLPNESFGTVQSIVLLREEDRSAAVWWMQNTKDMESIFNRLRRELFLRVSADGTIEDHEWRVASGTPVLMLSFIDPVVTEEEITFAGIGNTFYEFHGDAEEVHSLILLLTEGERPMTRE